MGKLQKKKEQPRISNPMKLRCSFFKKYFGWFWMHLKKLFHREQRSIPSRPNKNKRVLLKFISLNEISDSNGDGSINLQAKSQSFSLQTKQINKQKNKKVSIIPTNIEKDVAIQQKQITFFQHQHQPYFEKKQLKLLKYLYKQPQYKTQSNLQSYFVVNPINTYQQKNNQQQSQINSYPILQQNSICIDKKIQIFQQVNKLLSNTAKNSQIYHQQILPQTENAAKQFQRKLSKINNNIEERNTRKKLLGKLNQQNEKIQKQQQIKKQGKLYNIEDILQIIKSPPTPQPTPISTAEALFLQTIKSLQLKKQQKENQAKCKIEYVEPSQQEIQIQEPQQIQSKPNFPSITTSIIPITTPTKFQNPFIREKGNSNPSLLVNLMKNPSSDIQSFMKQIHKKKTQQNQQIPSTNPPQYHELPQIPSIFSQSNIFTFPSINFFSQSIQNPFLTFSHSQTKFPQYSSLFSNPEPQSTKLSAKQERKKKNKEERIF